MQPTALITGASQGIGAAIAIVLADQGIHTLLLARDLEKLNGVAAKIREKNGTCTCLPCDITQSHIIHEMFRQVAESGFAMPSILVNNAGYGGPFHRTDEVSEKEWDQIFAINVKGPFLFSQKLLPAMKENRFGRIINIASVYGITGGAYSSTYAASKHALIGYSKSLAVEWGAWGITCNVISPGYVDTVMGAAANETQYTRIIDRIPAKRQGLPAEIAQTVLFLIQPGAGYINGANIVVDGGLTAGMIFD